VSSEIGALLQDEIPVTQGQLIAQLGGTFNAQLAGTLSGCGGTVPVATQVD
jgi:hypothetical protein